MRERLERLLGHVARADLDAHVPRRVRPHPAPRGAAARLPVDLHDLRPGRPDPARQAVPRGARARPEALHAARHPLRDLAREEQRSSARRSSASASRRFYDQTVAEVYELYQRSLFASNAVDFDDLLFLTVDVLERFPEARETLAQGLPLRPRRRVPGHEPRAVPAAAAARVRAPQPLRRRRPRSVDLRVPRGRHPQHPRLRARLSRHADDRARAELPLDEHDPRAANAVIEQQQRAQAEEPLVRARRGRADRVDRGRGRARRGALRRRTRSPRSSRKASPAARSRSSTGRTRSRACSRTCSCARASRTR